MLTPQNVQTRTSRPDVGMFAKPDLKNFTKSTELTKLSRKSQISIIFGKTKHVEILKSGLHNNVKITLRTL